MIFSIILGVILGVAVPILLPLIFNVTLTLDSQIVIGLLAAIIPVLLDISRDIEWLKKNKEIEKIVIDNRNSFDVELQKISRYYATLDDVEKKGIYSSYFQKEIVDIGFAMLDASQKKKFWGRIQNVVDEKYIMDCFRASKNKVWKFTWMIESDESPIIMESDVGWLTYWELAISLLKQNKFSQVEILFVTKEEITHKITTELTNLGMYVNGLNCSSAIKTKAICELEYQQKFRSAFQTSKNSDFGIYGDNLLFVYDSDNDEFGWYVKNKNEIKEYITFFDAVWKPCKDIKRK